MPSTQMFIIIIIIIIIIIRSLKYTAIYSKRSNSTINNQLC